ncbi:MAG TPA: hypothetical protein DCZ95_01365 [Verrucomicrobia bacterium]|nr:MAG: hypothetical protein A2X46_08915 [Lentisphaerae bacterium GWF2_57_35]HBA82717.1 hypothetical protein [Verrucomicrobiota bacterium]
MKRNVYARLVMLTALFAAFPLANVMAERDPTAIVTQAYEDILGRKPDKAGLSAYRSHIIDDGWSEQDVRNDLKKSDEYRTKGTDKIVNDAYQDLLGRKPDRDGLESYRRHMLDDGWSEKDVRNDLRNSAEYKNKHR